MPSDETDEMKEKIKNHIIDAAVHSNGVITKSATMEEITTERKSD
jgi:hypothetical protein